MATRYPSLIDLSALGEGGVRFTYNGGAADVVAVADAGDVNGDGFADLVVTGRPGSSNTVPLENYALYGSSEGIADGFDLADLDPSQGFRIEDTATIRQYRAQGVGDLNGDGYADIAVVSSSDPDSAFSYEDVNIIYGGADVPEVISLGALDGTNGTTLQTAFNLSWRFDGAGDINGDGVDDLVLGDRYIARVFYGSTSSQPPASQLSDVTEEVFNPTDWYSGATSIVGDINGDGFDDMRFGEAIVFGSADGFDPTLTVEDLDGTNGFRLLATAGTYAFQQAVSAGDVNGDGVGDFVIGSPNSWAHGHIEAGEAYVVFGRAGGFDGELDLSSLDGSNGFVIRGETLWHLGEDVAGAGDVDGDGFDDVVVRAGNGDAFVVFGQATFNGSGFDASRLDGTHGFRISSSNPYENISDLAGLGDFNGDGFADLGLAAREGGDGIDIPRGAIIYGQAPNGPVTLVDSAADQTLRGGAFDDIIISFGGNDRLIGGDGDDSLRSIEGSDIMEGGLGNDEYFVFADRSDTIIDAGGVDTIRATSHWDLAEYSEIENVRLAVAGDWHVRGNTLDNRLVAGAGDNVLMGEAGNDRLEGGAGNDRLIGGTGRDILIGGSGIDRFDFTSRYDSSAEAGGRDVVVDYATGELFNLARVDANDQRSGNQAFVFLETAEFTRTAGQLRYDTLTYTDGTVVTVVEGDTDGNGVADFGFELRGLHTLTAGDFVL